MPLPGYVVDVEPGHETWLATLKGRWELNRRHLLRKILELLDFGLPSLVAWDLLLGLHLRAVGAEPCLGLGVATEGIHPLRAHLLGLELLLQFYPALLLLEVELLEVDDGLDLAELLFFSLLRH